MYCLGISYSRIIQKFCTTEPILDSIDGVLCLVMTMLLIGLLKALEKLKRQLAEADAALEARKRPTPDTGLRVGGEGLVIDEWV